MRRTAARTPQQRLAQRGQALLILLMILGIGFGAWFYTFAGTSGSAVERDKITAAALAQAKEALIGRSVSDSNRPGSLPCPDLITNIVGTNVPDDGIADLFAGNDCPSNIGRLPWKTLDLPDLRDASGERLWYVLSANFRDNAAAEPINSDTKGTISVYVGDSATLQTSEAVAVIFAPGASIGNNLRDAAGMNNAANYLDSASGINNANAAGPYIATPPTTTFNDRLQVITTSDLITRVEQRVARELLNVLRAYKANSGCNCYPWPDVSTGFSDFGLNRSRIPGYDLAGTTSPPYALPVDWGVGSAPTLPQWFIDNEWRRIIYYAVGKNFLENSGSGCTTCEAGQTTLSVDGTWGREVVLLTPGPAGPGRPVTPYPWTNWTPYLVDAENNNNNDRYITPSSSAYARNRIYTIP